MKKKQPKKQPDDDASKSAKLAWRIVESGRCAIILIDARAAQHAIVDAGPMEVAK